MNQPKQAQGVCKITSQVRMDVSLKRLLHEQQPQPGTTVCIQEHFHIPCQCGEEHVILVTFDVSLEGTHITLLKPAKQKQNWLEVVNKK
jgi:hypothetical protein